MRQIEQVSVVTPDGIAESQAEAIAYIESFEESRPKAPLARYEIGVRYRNGDEVRGHFNDKATAIEFLRGVRKSHPTRTI